MKKIIFILSVVAASMMATSCMQALDNVAPKNAIPVDKLTSNELGKLINGTLFQMEGFTQSYWWDGSYMGEDLIEGPGGKAFDPHADTMDPSASRPSSRWNKAFTVLKHVNGLLDAANAAPNGATKTEALGVAYFCRAYIYYNLVIRFGNVPIVRNTTNDVIPISNQAAVWTMIKEDINNALKYVPALSNKYYISKEAVKCLQAYVHLWNGENDEAIACADEVIGNKSLVLSGTSEKYASMFISGTTCEEMILSWANTRTASFLRLFDYTNDTDGSWTCAAPEAYREGLFANTGGDATREGDIRQAVCFTSSDWKRIIKFPNGNDALGQFIKNDNPSSSPLMVFRLADAYLVKAEALINKGESSKADAIATLATFMSKRYSKVEIADNISLSALEDLLMDELHREFYAEGRRWFEIKRRHRLDLYKQWPGEGYDYLLLWPIPLSQRELAGFNNYPQNPGYAGA